MNRNQEFINMMIETAEDAMNRGDCNLCTDATLAAIAAKADGESEEEFHAFVKKTQETIRRLIPEFFENL